MPICAPCACCERQLYSGTDVLYEEAQYFDIDGRSDGEGMAAWTQSVSGKISILAAVSSSAAAAHRFPQYLSTTILQYSRGSEASQSRNWLSVTDLMPDRSIHLLSVNSLFPETLVSL